ncbi:signal peptidase II [Fodinicurvata sp. EGI_FJ10296]|uniref:signal peptidase II n=1 Tax=Fodinicurvata sp. EGI_FJ10296 TaxID=3231908 RepID=UPI0034553395
MMRFGLGISLVVIVIDQVTKSLMLYGVFGFDFPAGISSWHPAIAVTGFFNLVTVWNMGVSFGMFSAGSPVVRWLLIAVAVGISVGMLVWLSRAGSRLVAAALGLIVGGAMGNVIDRILYGAVADFLDFHIWGYHWPAFNVADSAIMIGVALLLYDSIVGQTDHTNGGPASGRHRGDM